MSTPSPYFQPLQGYQGGYEVTRPLPTYPYPLPSPPAYYAPRRGSLGATALKVAVGGGVTVATYYIVAKILQSQNINAGCPSGQVGLPFLCAPASGGGPPPGATCSRDCDCPSGQTCSNGKCVNGTNNCSGGQRQIPGSVTGPAQVNIDNQVCQPVKLGVTSCELVVCGTPIQCLGRNGITVTLLDNTAQKLPIANATILVVNPNPNVVQADAQSYQTDANGQIHPVLSSVQTPTFACNKAATQDATISFVVQALLPGAGGPSLTVYAPVLTTYTTNEGFAGSCGGCSNCFQ